MINKTDLNAAMFGRSCICQALRRTARQITRRYEAALKPVGLKAGQFTILAALLRDHPVRLTELADQLGMDRTTLTKDLRPLEKRNLIASGIDEKDGRVRNLALTPEGRDLILEAAPLWEAAQKISTDRINPDEWAGIRTALDRLTS